MLRDGKLGGKEDHELIMHMMRADFMLPVYPLWDPEGLILGEDADIRRSLTDYMNQRHLPGVASGFFSPRTWGSKEQVENQLQTRLKLMILRRLYPGLRTTKDEEIMRLLKSVSPTDEQDYSLASNPVTFFNEMKNYKSNAFDLDNQ